MTPRVIAMVALVVAAVAVAVVIGSSGGRRHTVRAAFAAAENVFPGQEVRLAGVKVGSIADESVDGGEVVLRLKIDHGELWPLHRGTTATIRYGRTASTFERYVALTPGPRTAPALANDALLPRTDAVTPVEFDQIFGMFDRPTRHALRGLIDHSAAVLGPRARALGEALQQGAGGLGATADVMGALGADQTALRILVASGARTTRALADEDPRLRQLIGTAATTFDALARHSRAITAALERGPATMDVADAALAHADRSVSGLDGLVADIGPGARGLRALAPPTRRALDVLDRVAPLAAGTLSEAARSAPAIGRLLRAATPFVGVLSRVASRSGAQLACVRPYAPEIAGFMSTWAGYTQNYDATNHYARVLSQTPPFSDGTSMTSAQVVSTYPGQLYAFPRPPGFSIGQTWLQAACGAGASAVDAGADPEARG